MGTLVLGLLLGVPVAAHEPAGRVIDVPHLEVPPLVDGELVDWEGPPLLDTGMFTDLVGGATPEAEDFAVRVWVGWNDTENRLYVAASTEDDIHQVDREAGTATTRIFLDDDMEIFVDADHSGGQYADFSDLTPEEQFARNGTEANHFVLAGLHADGDHMVMFSGAGWYAGEQSDYTRAAVTFEGTPGGRGTTNYEISLVPFDRINVTADFLSREHDLRPGEILGFNLEFTDFDEYANLFDAKWSLAGTFNAHRLSERFLDIRLGEPATPTAIRDDSWGRIKATFRR
jgi:hypothetical protein